MFLTCVYHVEMQGGKIICGGGVVESEGNFVQPTIVEISSSAEVVKEELFAPVLHVMKFQVCLLFSCPKISSFRRTIVSHD